MPRYGDSKFISQIHLKSLNSKSSVHVDIKHWKCCRRFWKICLLLRSSVRFYFNQFSTVYMVVCFWVKNLFLMGTWGESNNFALKCSLLIIKQNGTNQIFQTFTCKPQLAYYVCSFARVTPLTLRHRQIILSFVTS